MLTRQQRTRFLALFRTVVTAREIDRREAELVQQGYGFFHVSGSGHESTAALARHLIAGDYLHLHYRDKALMLERGMRVDEFFLSLLCKADSHSAGRQMSAHLSDADRNILSLVGPVGNNALQAVGVAAAIADEPHQPLVVCAVGDGTTQEGEFLEAVAEAARRRIPVLFVVEDNGLAISTRTVGKTAFSDESAPSLSGVPIGRVDGTDIVACDETFAQVVQEMRSDRRPQIIVLKLPRLANHTNADDQELYRSLEEVSTAMATQDPLFLLQDQLLRSGIELSQLEHIRGEARESVRGAAVVALEARESVAEQSAKASLPSAYFAHAEHRGDGSTDVSMREALNHVLHQHLEQDPRVYLYGEDIEDPKGDVFGVTRQLSSRFPGRVENAPLSESTIVGTAIGRALAGQRPVAFLQFADFLPLAWNQILSEMGSIHWRTQGRWQCPVIVMITCGGYRPGLGPFHSQSLESVAAHTPGVDVVMPSTAGDAAGLLHAAFASGRPTLFFYPKACLNQSTLGTSKDIGSHFVPVGRARFWKRGRDLTIVSWGNPLRQCQQVCERLEDAGMAVDLIDLRSLSPWDAEAVVRSSERTGRLIVVHEDNHTCGFGAEVAATVAERAQQSVQIRRVTRPDTLVPCNFGNQLEILPSARRILTTASQLLGLDLAWQEATAEIGETLSVDAIGSGPADDEVTLIEIRVKPGQSVAAGDLVAEVEAAKAVVEMVSPIEGIVQEVFHREGEVVSVGTPLLSIRPSGHRTHSKPVTQEILPPCALTPETPCESSTAVARSTLAQTVVLRDIETCLGARTVSNTELLTAFPDWNEADVDRRVGISERRWVGKGQDVLSLATEASRALLIRANVLPEELGLVIVATTTPDQITPSLACRICARLQSDGPRLNVPALDINAACSGYLYALQIAWDHLQAEPEQPVMVVTAEVLSPLVDPQDPQTAFIFGDAATASLLHAGSSEREALQISRPVISGEPEAGHLLSVPLNGRSQSIRMEGPRVFQTAVRTMDRTLQEACQREGIALTELGCVIPHQASARILAAVEKRLQVPVYRHLNSVGNTSSSSIPLAIQNYLATTTHPASPIGLCSFGGGFTSAAAIARWNGANVKQSAPDRWDAPE